MDHRYIKIDFQDNNFAAAALATAEALTWCLDFEKMSLENILKEFIDLLHHLVNIKYRNGFNGYDFVEKDYFIGAKISASNDGAGWNNSKTVVINTKTKITYLL